MAKKEYGDRDLGTVKKRLSSGIFETTKGEKIPPFPGVQIGTKLKLERHRFIVVDGGKKGETAAADAEKNTISTLKAENADLKKRMDAMEKAYGEKGANVKTSTESTGNGAATEIMPPKVGA